MRVAHVITRDAGGSLAGKESSTARSTASSFASGATQPSRRVPFTRVPSSMADPRRPAFSTGRRWRCARRQDLRTSTAAARATATPTVARRLERRANMNLRVARRLLRNPCHGSVTLPVAALQMRCLRRFTRPARLTGALHKKSRLRRFRCTTFGSFPPCVGRTACAPDSRMTVQAGSWRAALRAAVAPRSGAQTVRPWCVSHARAALRPARAPRSGAFQYGENVVLELAAAKHEGGGRNPHKDAHLDRESVRLIRARRTLLAACRQ